MTTCLNQFLINNEILTKPTKLKYSSKKIKGIQTSILSISTDYIILLTFLAKFSFSLSNKTMLQAQQSKDTKELD